MAQPENSTLPPLHARIFLLEDDRLSRELLERSLGLTGAEVRSAASCAATLAAVAADPDWAQIFLIDYSLPDGTGLEVTQALCRNRDAKAAPRLILGLTGYHDTALAANWTAAGALRVLIKPIRGAVLRGIIAEHLFQPAPETSRLEGLDLSAFLATDLVENLVQEMGTAPTQSFMHRALNESEIIAQQAVTTDAQDLRRQLHSALGAVGMTGLCGMERALKALQTAVHADTERQTATEGLWACLAATRTAITERFSA